MTSLPHPKPCDTEGCRNLARITVEAGGKSYLLCPRCYERIDFDTLTDMTRPGDRDYEC